MLAWGFAVFGVSTFRVGASFMDSKTRCESIPIKFASSQDSRALLEHPSSWHRGVGGGGCKHTNHEPPASTERRGWCGWKCGCRYLTGLLEGLQFIQSLEASRFDA